MSGRPPWLSGTRNYAAETGLYKAASLRGDEPPVPANTEQFFSDWEGLFSNAWPQIFDHGACRETRKNLARFLGTLLARHTDERDLVHAINRISLQDVEGVPDEEIVEFVNPNSGQSFSIAAGEIRKFAKTDPESVRNDFIRDLQRMSENYAEALFERKWGLALSTGVPFITSDRPVALKRGDAIKQTYGFATPGTTIHFPVCPRRMLIIDDSLKSEFAFLQISDDEFWIEAVVASAHRFVFSSQKDEKISRAIRRIRASRALQGQVTPLSTTLPMPWM